MKRKIRKNRYEQKASGRKLSHDEMVNIEVLALLFMFGKRKIANRLATYFDEVHEAILDAHKYLGTKPVYMSPLVLRLALEKANKSIVEKLKES